MFGRFTAHVDFHLDDRGLEAHEGLPVLRLLHALLEANAEQLGPDFKMAHNRLGDRGVHRLFFLDDFLDQRPVLVHVFSAQTLASLVDEAAQTGPQRNIRVLADQSEQPTRVFEGQQTIGLPGSDLTQ